MKRTAKKKVVLVGMATVLLLMLVGGTVAGFHGRAQAASGCQFLSSPASTPAFCDTFDAPAGTGNRSGDLNGTVWGVSRVTQQQGFGQNGVNGWPSEALDLCGTTVTTFPERDVRICDGHVAEAVDDGGNAAALGMYPKQPFDIAGRTGTVVFDVSNDTQGAHAAWPEFWFADTPTPVPFNGFPNNNSAPHRGFGIRMFGTCTAANGQPGWMVSTMDTSNNYVDNMGQWNTGTGVGTLTQDECPSSGSTAANTLNHVEIQLSVNRADVWSSDAYPVGGTPGPLHHVASMTNLALPLTRGVIWLMDAHYNGGKGGGSQGDHTFYWDNVGFDGPVLPQDRTYDVLDATAGYTGTGYADLGYDCNLDCVLTTLPVDSGALAQANGALLTFSYWAATSQTAWRATVNGHAVSLAVPFDPAWMGVGTFGMPLPLSDVVAGPNTITFNEGAETALMNVDLILVGGGGTGSVLPTPTSGGNTPTPVPTIPPTPLPTSTPTPSPTPPALLGDNQIEAQLDSNVNGQAQTWLAKATGSGTLNALHVYLDSTNAASTITVGVYSDSAGQPAALLTSGTLTNPTAGAWNSVSVAPISLTQGASYWLALLGVSGSGPIEFHDTQCCGTSWGSNELNLTTLPGMFTVGPNWSGSTVSIYGDGTGTLVTPTPTPISLSGVPCTVTLGGVQQTGICSGTFTP